MTEEEWLACDDPGPMLGHLDGRASDRKLRLFAVACCRRMWPLLPDGPARTAVDVAERYADGLADRAAIEQAVWAVPLPDWPGVGRRVTDQYTVKPGLATDLADPRTYAWLTAQQLLPGLTPERAAVIWAGDGARFVPGPDQAADLRDIIGNPFRPAPFDPRWRTAPALALAGTMYEARDFAPMPILADALDEAGCDNADILAHCRSAGPHVRGCWVVDLILGKS